MNPGNPLERLEISHGQSYLAELRGKGGTILDFQPVFRAVAVDSASYHPSAVCADLRVDGKALLWFTPGLDAAVVDSTLFSDLQVADVTRLKAGARIEVGRLRQPSRWPLGPRGLVLFLLRAGIVQTYAHLEAHLRLEGETDETDRYEARFAGTHVYFTNEENRDDYAFAVTYERKTGTITVTGR